MSKERKYKLRNLPCNVVPESQLWFVSGVDVVQGSTGVIEWCRDKVDAARVFREMKVSDEFDQLRYGQYIRHPS